MSNFVRMTKLRGDLRESRPVDFIQSSTTLPAESMSDRVYDCHFYVGAVAIGGVSHSQSVWVEQVRRCPRGQGDADIGNLNTLMHTAQRRELHVPCFELYSALTVLRRPCRRTPV